MVYAWHGLGGAGSGAYAGLSFVSADKGRKDPPPIPSAGAPAGGLGRQRRAADLADPTISVEVPPGGAGQQAEVAQEDTTDFVMTPSGGTPGQHDGPESWKQVHPAGAGAFLADLRGPLEWSGVENIVREPTLMPADEPTLLPLPAAAAPRSLPWTAAPPLGRTPEITATHQVGVGVGVGKLDSLRTGSLRRLAGRVRGLARHPQDRERAPVNSRGLSLRTTAILLASLVILAGLGVGFGAWRGSGICWD